MDSGLNAAGEIYQAGDLRIDVGSHRVTRQGIEVPLPNLSFELLLALARAHPRMLTPDELLETVWAPAVVNPETVGQRVKMLRQALGDDSRAPRYVVGVRGKGYRMDVPVTRATHAPSPDASPEPESAGPTPRPDPITDAPTAPRRARPTRVRDLFWALGAAALVAAGVVGYVALRPERAGPGSAPPIARQPPARAVDSGIPVSEHRKPRLAILPFENLSPDPANAFFTDGMHEEILATLSRLAPGMEVISRTTMVTYRGTPKPLEVIARELGATHVLEGSVRREGKHVRLTVQLIDARTDDHLWAQDYDRPLGNVLDLQSDVATQIALQLSVQLATRAAESKPLTSDPQAYDAFLKAQLLAGNSVVVGNVAYDSLRRIVSLLDEALAHDPQFAAAYARRSQFRSLEWYFNYDTEGRLLAPARKDMETAERLAPDDPAVLFTKGHWRYENGDLNGALVEFGAAEAAGLSDPMSVGVISEVLGFTGRVDEAILRAQRAMTLDPKNRYVLTEVVFLQQIARRPKDALQTLEFGLAQFPKDDVLRNLAARVTWAFTGNERALKDAAAITGGIRPDPAVDTNTLDRILDPMRFEDRYRDMAAVLRRVPTGTIRGNLGWGQTPLAEYRGWIDLLSGNRAAAAKDGREVLDFVARRGATERNRAFIEALTAEGWTFLGDRSHALTATHAIPQLTHSQVDVFRLNRFRARLYAWVGAEDEAVALLEELSAKTPMSLPPAEIARDPLFTKPLAGNARYRALQAKLEAQMAATRLH